MDFSRLPTGMLAKLAAAYLEPMLTPTIVAIADSVTRTVLAQKAPPERLPECLAAAGMRNDPEICKLIHESYVRACMLEATAPAATHGIDAFEPPISLGPLNDQVRSG